MALINYVKWVISLQLIYRVVGLDAAARLFTLALSVTKVAKRGKCDVLPARLSPRHDLLLLTW